MTADVIVALIGAGGFIVAAVLNHQIRAIRRDTTASREQVENDHTPNLRVELDDRHEETLRGMHRIDKHLEGMGSDVRGIRKDIARLDSKDERLDDRLHDLEKKE
jgi:archaellum component FlaC